MRLRGLPPLLAAAAVTWWALSPALGSRTGLAGTVRSPRWQQGSGTGPPGTAGTMGTTSGATSAEGPPGATTRPRATTPPPSAPTGTNSAGSPTGPHGTPMSSLDPSLGSSKGHAGITEPPTGPPAASEQLPSPSVTLSPLSSLNDPLSPPGSPSAPPNPSGMEPAPRGSPGSHRGHQTGPGSALGSGAHGGLPMAGTAGPGTTGTVPLALVATDGASGQPDPPTVTGVPAVEPPGPKRHLNLSVVASGLGGSTGPPERSLHPLAPCGTSSPGAPTAPGPSTPTATGTPGGPTAPGDLGTGETAALGLPQPSGTPGDTGSPTATPSSDTGSPTAIPSGDIGSPMATPSHDMGSPTATLSTDTGTPVSAPSHDTGSPTDTPFSDSRSPVATNSSGTGSPYGDIRSPYGGTGSPSGGTVPSSVATVTSGGPGSPSALAMPGVFVVEDQAPLLRASLLRVPCELLLDMGFEPALADPASRQHRELLRSFNDTISPLFVALPGFVRLELQSVRGSVLLRYDALFAAAHLPPQAPALAALLNGSLAPARLGLAVGAAPVLRHVVPARPLDPCAELFSCPTGFECVSAAAGAARCTSVCHRHYCKNQGVCSHARGRPPACRCPVGSDFWFVGLRCDYRVTQQSLLGMACGALLSLALLGALVVGLIIRRFRALLLQAKVDQSKSSYRRFCRLDDVSGRSWSQPWLGSASSLDNPAFSNSEELLQLHVLQRGGCGCGCRDGTPGAAQPAAPPAQSMALPRPQHEWDTSGSSITEPMVDSGKASDTSVCSWPPEPPPWAPLPLARQRPQLAQRPRSRSHGMEPAMLERSWTA